jgi:putative transcriptional regulator
MNRVKEYRKLLGLTQIELARQIGIARQTINLIENEKYNPTLALCISLAKALQTDLNTLFWEDEVNERTDF